MTSIPATRPKRTCLINGVCLDLQRMETLLMCSAIAGGATAAVSYFAFREQAFVVPALYATGASFAVGYFTPTLENAYRSAGVGAVMAAVCSGVERGAAQDCLKYGGLTALSHYAATQFIVPKLNEMGYLKV